MKKRNLYLDLIKKCLTNVIYGKTEMGAGFVSTRLFYKIISKAFSAFGLYLVHIKKFDPNLRKTGRDWPITAHTMVGLKRLDNIQFCVEEILKNNIPGDLIEAGVWRGGATILMRAILKAYDVKDRYVWVADSFKGLPKPNIKKYPLDATSDLHAVEFMKVSLEEVRDNFRSYGLLDNQVRFLKGWFKDSLPRTPIKQLALIRIDADLYESTMDVLINLYPKLSNGGYIIIDDYRNLSGCRKAVKDYRELHKIYDKIIPIDWSAVYWKRSK